VRLHHLGRLLLSCLLTESSGMCQCRILTCQSVLLVGIDGDHALGDRHLHRGIDNVDDHHKFQEGGPPENAVVPDVKAGYLKRQHLLALVVPYSTGHLQVDASNVSG
jgi:hypothetical protein